MDDFDPYAEPKPDSGQTKSPEAPTRIQDNATRKEKGKSRAEFQDFDPHLTLSFNGSPLRRLLDKRKVLNSISDTLKGITGFSLCYIPPSLEMAG